MPKKDSTHPRLQRSSQRRKTALEHIARSIFETANEGIWVLDENAQIITINQRMSDMLGYSVQEMVGKYKWNFLFEEDQQRTKAIFERRKQGISEQVDIRFRTKEGKSIWTLMSARPIFMEKQFAGALDMFSDVTERRAAEEAAIAARNRLTTILDSISDGFMTIDKSWNVSYLNRELIQILTLLGKAPEDVIGKNLWDLFPDVIGTETEKRFHTAMDESKSVEFEAYYSPLKRWFEVRAYGSSDGITVYSRDITDRKKSELELRSSLREKEALLQEVHHRVKNNLQIITSLLGLQSHRVDNAEMKSILRDSEDRVRAMALVHQQLYDESNQFSSIPFEDYVRVLTDALLRSHALNDSIVQINVNGAGLSVPITQAVPLGLITNEIISNCLKYAFRGKAAGTIHITLSPSNTDQLALTIADDGIGIPEGLDYHGGKTLGMRLIQLLSRQIEGNVQIDSKPNFGTSIRIEFPKIQGA
jgi:PAS domain S-box-containing protein